LGKFDSLTAVVYYVGVELASSRVVILSNGAVIHSVGVVVPSSRAVVAS
jgi:hypothetical protein